MPALLKTTQIQEPSSASVNLTLDTSGNGTFAGTSVMSSPYTMRNKIINGAMQIDQRNAGASVTINSTANTYVVDRWNGVGQPADGVFTLQQSSTAPAGFTNSLIATVTTADSSIGATQYYLIRQVIEGFNLADMGFGTANARTFTLSFWVRSSLTGTFGGAATNNVADYCYPFSYTISSANTWEQKTVTITGPTAGTFNTTNGGGLNLYFSLGMGSTYKGTSGSWAAATYFSSTGATDLISTNGATFYITGVQLERGTVATPFEYRNYQQELAMCQRYYCKTFDVTTAPAQNSTSVGAIWGSVRAFGGAAGSSWEPQAMWFFPVTMRAAPTVTVYAAYAGITSGQWGNSSSVSAANTRVLNTGMTSAVIDNTGNTVAFGSNSPNIQLTASIEL